MFELWRGLQVAVWLLIWSTTAGATVFNVAVNSSNFNPSNLTITQGDQVHWFWNGSGSHTTTHVPSGGQQQLWDEPITSSNQDFSRTFNTAGTYNYRCTPHGFTGRVTVNPMSGIFDETGDAATPADWALEQNSPNPFNSSTQIVYSLDRDQQVALSVYNILGQRVATLIDGFQSGGQHTAVWDGIDAHGNDAPSGIYFARMVSAAAVKTRKMVLLR